ncbi:MAG: NfeD family protein [Propionibacterium sp.]
MREWLTNNAWAVWMAAGALLGILEFLSTDLTLLMLASGAVAGGLTALAFPHLFWMQILVAAVVAWVMLAFLRPTLLRRVRNAIGYRSNLDRMVGAPGIAITELTPTGGEVKVSGETWTARTMQGTIAAGEEIEVYEIDGAIAIVYPRHQPLP